MNAIFDLEQAYLKTHINGTVYVTSRLPLPAERITALEAGAGELFLVRIKKDITAEDIMRVAVELGVVYKLRFKIDFSGASRGYAYLQYLDEPNMKHVMWEYAAAQVARAFENNRIFFLFRLRLRFRLAKLNIQVRQSRNKRELLLHGVDHLTPLQVYDELRQVCSYVKLRVFEHEPQQYVYIIVYRNNDDAAQAHHTLRYKMGIFGAGISIDWVSRVLRKRSDITPESNCSCCCVRLRRSEVPLQLPARHICFTM
ncbi:hypothetical protein KR222_009641 [Zaprionus bogoriensis]|nr:hypothetical protein KR222_009641 [Zaprionus bogoriensis]